MLRNAVLSMGFELPTARRSSLEESGSDPQATLLPSGQLIAVTPTLLLQTEGPEKHPNFVEQFFGWNVAEYCKPQTTQA